MYIPSAFRVEDVAKLIAFIQRYNFATLITCDGAAPFASHLPMLFYPGAGCHGTLVSHMARANPQWQNFASGREVLVVFQGPHSYISPSWYKTEPAVPTWNYVAVHAYGIPKVLDQPERVLSILHDTILVHESSFERPWPGTLPNEYRDKLIQNIVAFEISLTRIEGKFKLGQNRSAADLKGVFDALSSSDDAEHHALAKIMAAECDIGKNAS
ncbi:MAG: FMN-binding negative transcriptional regulator [Pedosphaera sp.]|nr:FMN-binding negative transcriptional regulator [Pedosphaera sp.]